jgi:hypothetical protein
VVWSTAAVPADNSDRNLEDDKRNVGMTLHGGSVFRVTELGPGFATPMHRTFSIDYCLVLSAELEVTLDGGETIKLFAGDTVVQRGVHHAYHQPRLEAQAELVHGGDGRQDHQPRPGAHVRRARATATKWRRREPARGLHPHLSGERQLLRASIAYLPLVLVLMMLNKKR